MSTTPSATPPSTPTIHCPVNYGNNLNESWCDIQYKSGCSSSGSISHLHHTVNPEVLEKLLYEAQRESASPTHVKLPEPSNRLEQSSNECLVDSIHKLDTSTPMLVTFEAGTCDSPINPTSPISKIPSPLTQSLATVLSPVVDCSQCHFQKQQIARLLERQSDTERQLTLLRKEYEEKCLSKTPDAMSQSIDSSISTSSLNEQQDRKRSQVESLVSSLKRQNSSTATLVSLTHNQGTNCYASGIFNHNAGPEAADWTKYWASRPQTQPPKEWNFVHPNSAKSKLNKMQNMDSTADNSNSIIAKYVSCDSIGKLLFTHMASFIVGATLMFLVIRRHLNLRSSIFMK